MLNIDMLCHCPKRLSLPFCDVCHWQVPALMQNKEAV